MVEVAKLSAIIDGDTRPLEKATQHANSLLGNVGSGLGNIAGLAFTGAAVGVAGLAAGLGAATKSAADFQSQISGIAAVGGADAVARMSEISAKALQVGKDTSFSASEAASGMEELIKAGVSINDVLGGATDATVALAAATGVNLAGAAEIASNAMNQFGLKGAEIGTVADIVAGAANASAIDVNDFKFSLAAAGAAANLAGFTFKDTAVAIAAMGQAGIKGSDAGTSLKTMFMNLQPTTKAQVAIFRQLGLSTDETSSTFFDMAGKVKPMREVFGLLNKSLEGYTEQQKLAALETIFGSDAIRAGAIAAKLGAEGFDEMAAAMDKVSAADVAKTRLDNLNGSLEALKGSLEVAGITIGTAMLPTLKLLTDGAIEMLNANMPLIEQFAADLPGAMAAAGTFITGTLMPALSELTAALGPPLQSVITWLTSTGWPALVGAGDAVQAGIAEINTVLGALFAEMDKRGVFTDLNAIWTDLSAIAGDLGEMIGGLAPPIRDADEQTARMNATTGTTAGIFKEASGGVATFVAQVRSIVDAAKAAGEWLDNLQRTINGAGLSINAQLRSMGIPMGNGFVTGVATGINQGVPALEAAASNAAGVVPQAFRDDWMMHSPSQVAIDQGLAYASGLAIGISQGDSAVAQAVLAIVKNALLNNIDPMIALALAKAESNFKSGAVGDSGASVGLFQLHERGQGAGMGASRADPWVNASKFLGAHGELFQQLKASGLAGEELAATFGRLAEVSDPQFAHRYATAYRELVAQFGATGAAAMALTGTTGQLGAAQQQSNVWAEQMAAEQAALNQVMAGQAPAMRPSIDAMTAFGQVLGPIERQVAGGSISMETLRFKLVDLARATGIATKPWDDYSAGLIDIDEAMMRVVNQSADAGPQFDALRQQLGTTNTITNEGTLAFLQLALAAARVTPATAAATTATTGLTSATTSANDAIDPALLRDAADASRQLSEALNGTNSAFGGVKEAAAQASSIIREFLGASQSLGDYLEGHTFDFKVNIPDIPDWATPGSPTPFEMGLRGIGRELEHVNRITAPSLRDLAPPALVTAGSGGDGGGLQIGTMNFYQQPGEDSREFARRVGEVLESRSATARRRG